MSLLGHVDTYALRLCKETYQKNPALAKKIISLFNDLPINLDDDAFDYLIEFMYNKYFTILKLITPYILTYDEKLSNWSTGDEGVMLLIITHPYIYEEDKIHKQINIFPSKYPRSFIKEFIYYHELAYYYMENKLWYCCEYLDADYQSARNGIDNRILLYFHQDGFDMEKILRSLYYFYKYIECLGKAVNIAEREIGYVVTPRTKKNIEQS